MGLKLLVGIHLHDKSNIYQIKDIYDDYKVIYSKEFVDYCVRYNKIRVLDLMDFSISDMSIEDCNSLGYTFRFYDSPLYDLTRDSNAILGVLGDLVKDENFIELPLSLLDRQIVPFYYDGKLVYKSKDRVLKVSIFMDVAICQLYLDILSNTVYCTLNSKIPFYGDIDLANEYIINSLYIYSIYKNIRITELLPNLVDSLDGDILLFRNKVSVIALGDSDIYAVPNGVTKVYVIVNGSSNLNKLHPFNIIIPPTVTEVRNNLSNHRKFIRFALSKNVNDYFLRTLYDEYSSIEKGNRLCGSELLDRKMLIEAFDELEYTGITFY